MSLITAVSSLVSALTTDTFSFIHGDKYWNNLKASDITLPIVWLDYPIVSNDEIQVSGALLPKYPVRIFFCDIAELDYTPTQHQVIIDKMRLAAREFILMAIDENDTIMKIENCKILLNQ